MELRDYQLEAVYSVMRYFDKYKGDAGNPLIAMPTGTGKSLVIAGLLKMIYQWFPGQRVMMLTHVKELIEQNYDKLIRHWPEAPAGIYSAGLNRSDVHNMITFAGIQSVGKKSELFGKQDILLIDEAHLISPEQNTLYGKFIEALRKVNPYLKVIGFTATPYRLGYGPLVQENSLFNDIVFDMTTMNAFNWFIQEGYLLPVVPKRTRFEYDVSGVAKRGGEYIAQELQNAVNKDELTLKAMEETVEVFNTENRQSILIFCAGIDHAVDTADMLTSLGIECKAVHSKLTTHQRDTILSDFKSGKLQAVANNGVLTTGFDHPALDLIVVLRPTSSVGLWVQILGRGTRPYFSDAFGAFDLLTTQGRLDSILASTKQNCRVLDFSGNTRRLGPINDPLVPKKKGDKTGVAPVKLCPACEAYNHASARYCGGAPAPFHLSGYCGLEFPIVTKLKQAASTEVLIKQEVPITEVFKVDEVVYSRHSKIDKPNSLKVSYHCGYKLFSEYICIEHDGFAKRKALTWWRERCQYPFPNVVDEALEITNEIKTPTHLRVHTNIKHPAILAYCYDGSAFNTEQPSDDRPEVTAYMPDGSREQPHTKVAAGNVPENFDDDIPF